VAAIRVVFQTNRESDLAALQPATVRARQAAGFLQAEDFRSIEFSDHLLHLQLWESAQAWDGYWHGLAASEEGRRLIAVWSAAVAPHHEGFRNQPRRTGQNGVEFYKQARFSPVDGVWAMTDPAERAESIRWPAWSAVRIVIQVTAAPGADLEAAMGNFAETRAEPGCRHFEVFRGLEFEENAVLIETWSTPEIYDAHWMQRLVQARARAADGEGERPAPPARRYGEMGFEWYPLCYYSLAGEVWEPEDPKLRMSTVYW
jgi:quinol monooxygenase YgiN